MKHYISINMMPKIEIDKFSFITHDQFKIEQFNRCGKSEIFDRDSSWFVSESYNNLIFCLELYSS